ncbi:hypothetical protein [Polyangium aurulentum]|uniref:hypothetical protein n=1 Tax=Polyangium aurulentum TaxID=2567896 RepID=UPI0010ADC3D4|nr:hypothetical protein [Polyangium aurulentum]UQA54558.1 hypothetical protein E8A73_024615 [Polyangium aurulentum]
MKRARILAAALALAFVPGAIVHSLPRADAAPAAPPEEAERPIDFEPILVEDDLKPPKSSEWVNAARVRITRRGPRAAGCRAWRTRSWLKVHCDAKITAAALVGGTSAGTSFWLSPPKPGEPSPEAGEVMFPMRPGDRRIFELFSFGETYGGSMVSPGLVLQEYWLAGEPAPTVVMY